MIVFNCEECGRSLTSDDERAGESQTCRHCGKSTTIPLPDPDPLSGTLLDIPIAEDEAD
ncbi:MAG: hypothetical protein ACE5KM_23130 [Planctomycetaceae bacterium]